MSSFAADAAVCESIYGWTKLIYNVPPPPPTLPATVAAPNPPPPPYPFFNKELLLLLRVTYVSGDPRLDIVHDTILTSKYKVLGITVPG